MKSYAVKYDKSYLVIKLKDSKKTIIVGNGKNFFQETTENDDLTMMLDLMLINVTFTIDLAAREVFYKLINMIGKG